MYEVLRLHTHTHTHTHTHREKDRKTHRLNTKESVKRPLIMIKKTVIPLVVVEVKGEDDVVALTQYSSNPISRVQNSLTKFPVLIVISQRSLSSPDCNFTDDFFDTLGIKAPVTGQCFNVVKITVCVTGVFRIRVTPNISSVFIGHVSVCTTRVTSLFYRPKLQALGLLPATGVT